VLHKNNFAFMSGQTFSLGGVSGDEQVLQNDIFLFSHGGKCRIILIEHSYEQPISEKDFYGLWVSPDYLRSLFTGIQYPSHLKAFYRCQGLPGILLRKSEGSC